MSLTGAINNYKKALVKLIDHQVKKAYELAQNDAKDSNEDVDEEIARELAPLVRTMLLANFMRSGIQSHSGLLRQAIANAKVWIKRTNTTTKIMIGFKPGLPQNKGHNPYVYGSALNFGAVYQRHPILGEKAKRRIKRTVHQISRQPLTEKYAGGFSRAAHKMKFRFLASGSMRIGRKGSTLTITRARNFFTLTPAQEQELRSAYASLLRAKRQVAAVA